MLAPQRLAFDQRADHIAEAEEERLAQRETGGDIHAVDREEVAQLHFARVRRRVIVEASGIGFEQCARILRQFGKALLGSAACVEQMVGIVEGRAVLPGDCAIAPAAHRDHVLQGGKIVLRMGDGHAIGNVGIPLAINVRHAEFVAHDFGSVSAVGGTDIVPLGPEGLPRRQRHESDEQQDEQREPAARKPFTH